MYLSNELVNKLLEVLETHLQPVGKEHEEALIWKFALPREEGFNWQHNIHAIEYTRLDLWEFSGWSEDILNMILGMKPFQPKQHEDGLAYVLTDTGFFYGLRYEAINRIKEKLKSLNITTKQFWGYKYYDLKEVV